MPDLITALSQGRIDAGCIGADDIEGAPGGASKSWSMLREKYPDDSCGLGDDQDFIKNNPDKVRRYVQAYIESNKIARTDPETTSRSSGNTPRRKRKTWTKL